MSSENDIIATQDEMTATDVRKSMRVSVFTIMTNILLVVLICAGLILTEFFRLDSYKFKIQSLNFWLEKLAFAFCTFGIMLGISNSADEISRSKNPEYLSDIMKLKERENYIRALEKRASCPRTIIREVEKKVPVETPKSKVFSPESLVKYAITLPKDEDADFLATVMRDICFRERFVDDNVFKQIESIQTERDEAREKMKKKQEQKPSITYNINSVGQLNPVAEKVENNYERLSVGSQFDDILTTKAEVGEELPYSEIIKKTSSLIKKLTDLDISDDERRNEESN